MNWSPQQVEALDGVRRWLRNGTSPVYHLFGFAGTGKTTLAKHLAEEADGEVFFAAYTGKAAHVLRQKGCVGAATIHSLIYHSRDRSGKRLEELQAQREALVHTLRDAGMTLGEMVKHKTYVELTKEINAEESQVDQPFFVLNKDSPIRGAELIIIDECSMVDARMGADLLSFGIPVLVLGDPAQLPPVGGDGYFTKDVNPDMLLTEIHRQAADNPIIRLATMAREMKPLPLGTYGESRVLPNGKLDPEEVLAFDQMLVGKNVTRYASNRRLRKLKDILEPYPVVGDRLVCLKNNNELGLLNGAIFYVTDLNGVMDAKVHMSIRSEDSMMSQDVVAHEHHFLGRDKELAWFEKREAEMFDYGYALTVHKSQGSQWDSVCLLNESFCFRADRWKWLYTGITRAAKAITVVHM